MSSKSAQSSSRPVFTRLGLVLLVLGTVLCLLFGKAFLPRHVLFSNDGPLGSLMAACHRLPDSFTGGWEDLNSIGNRGGGAFPTVTYGLLWSLGPVGFAKFYAAIVLLFLGLGAWCFFRQLGFSRPACILGALAAALNSTFLSAAAWGVGTQPLMVGLMFFALAAVTDTTSPKRWLTLVLAGLAVGMGVSEGADIGAIFSIYVAAYVAYQAWVSEGPAVKRVGLGLGRVAIIAAFALFMAAHAISVLVGTQIKGVAGAQQDTQSKWERWDWATQWSLPKREALGLVVPGLFGYRMDTPNGGQYWGAVGRDPAWYYYWEHGSQGPPPQGGKRFGGGGIYAGVLVVMAGFWAALQAFRRKDSVFPEHERRMVWFWTAVVLISLLLAFGRFAPFYRLFYALPYSSTIRNPGKFAHIVSWALVVLFGYGINGLWRYYMQGKPDTSAGLKATVSAWWQRVRGFERRWTIWSFATLGACLLGWLIYASNRQGLENYLQQVDFDQPTAAAIASFSYGQVAWFVLTLALGTFLFVLVLSGAFGGSRAKWGAVILGLFVFLDLGRANQPWIIAWDYTNKYASNPIVDMLRQKPYEQRVALLPRWFSSIFKLPPQLENQEQLLNYLYGIEWSQHLFLYYNIQSLDVIQMPRKPEDLTAYDLAFMPLSGAQLPRLGRQWELTNTRYLIGLADFLTVLNQAVDPTQHSFRYKERFTIAPKPDYPRSNNPQDWTAVPDTNGPFAVFEFAGAVPRAKLYSNWELEVSGAAAVQAMPTNALSPLELTLLKHAGTNGFVNLQRLASPSFDPQQTVMVAPATGSPLPQSTNAAAAAGRVEIASYSSKHIALKAEAPGASVLLLNDHYDPDWHVTVDGKPATLLKCNYLMQGVFVQPGLHTVEFLFQPPTRSLYVSVAADALAVLLCGFLFVTRKTPEPEPPAPSPLANGQPGSQPRKTGAPAPKPAGTRK